MFCLMEARKLEEEEEGWRVGEGRGGKAEGRKEEKEAKKFF